MQQGPQYITVGSKGISEMKTTETLMLILVINPFINGQTDSVFNSDLYVDNEIDMKQTYRSPIEKFLQSLMVTLSSRQTSGLAERIFSSLPDSIKSFFFGGQQEITGRGFGDVLNVFRDDFQGIFPGTLWCGGGNVASSTDELGIFSQTDTCCRDHDACPYYIEAGKNMGLLKNNGIFTRSTCSCDYEFFQCLKKVNTVVSANIGGTYFTILRPQCFDYNYPIVSCDRYDSVRRVEKKCLEYSFNYSQNQTLEWYDLPDY